jgi:GWxTD domain-containing protein
MNIRRILITVALAAVAATAFALTPEHTEWAKGPVQHLMTKEETAQWKAIKSDEAADRFIALFWARRDPTPDTPRNEFREQYELRVRQADTNFSSDKTKGSMTDRGKALILYGMPKKIARSGQQRTSSQPAGIPEDPSSAELSDNNETFIWTYDEDAAKKYFNQPRAEIHFIDRFGNSDFRVERGGVDLTAAQQRAIAASITQPNLTVAPTFAPAPPQAATAPAAPAAPVIQTELTTEALKTALADFKKSSKSEKPIYAASGEFVTASGVTYAPVLVYIPKASAPGDNSTFFGVIEDAGGKSELAFEEPAKITATKDDFFVDKTLTLPAGKHRGYFGLADASGKVSLVALDMELAGSIDKDATATSPLYLSNNVFPLTAAQAPTDPFAFGGLKVVPKADRTFHTSDELWYFVELRNPGMPEAAPAADGSTVPPSPKLQAKLDVEGVDAKGNKTHMGAPPMEVAAVEVKGVPNHYIVGSSIPLTTFKPGDYSFNVKLIDTVKKTSYTYSEKFKVAP